MALRVLVEKNGYVPFDTDVVARAGELSPMLPVERKSIAQRWWFWTGIGVTLIGAVVGGVPLP